MPQNSLKRLILMVVATMVVSCQQPQSPPQPTLTAIKTVLSETSASIPLTQTAISTLPGPSETPFHLLPTAGMLGDIGITIPNGWYSTQVNLENLESLVFVKQNPEFLQSFDSQALAVPIEFAGGALVLSPLPAEGDGDGMSAWMGGGESHLNDQDLEAILAIADQIGLINMTAVEFSHLEQARSDTLSGNPAVVLDGTIHFFDAQPPVVRTQVWLGWTEQRFVTFYLFAAEETWQADISLLDETRNSLIIP